MLSGPTHQGSSRTLVTLGLILIAFISASWLVQPVTMRAQGLSSTTWTVTIVLPPRVVAGRPATLAVLGVDGRLAPGVAVEVGSDRVKTDGTGRASFTVPITGQILIARSSGTEAAALIDPSVEASDQPPLSVAPIVSLRGPFSICGSGFRGDADATHVRINGEPALVMAASPECLTLLPGAESTAGPAQISIVTAVTPGGRWNLSTTLVSLESEFAQTGLTPGEKSPLKVRVRGSQQRLHIIVENQAPGVLRFFRGDVQELFTTGGPENVASLEVQATRSGDFSFDARLMPAPDEASARAYLEAAVPLATQDLQRGIGRLVKQLARHPRDFEDARRDLDGMLSNTIAGDIRTLLAAARTALS